MCGTHKLCTRVLICCLQAAQEREELQAAGDRLDAKITQCEAEVSCSHIECATYTYTVTVQCGSFCQSADTNTRQCAKVPNTMHDWLCTHAPSVIVRRAMLPALAANLR
jgi:hypothetical protein